MKLLDAMKAVELFRSWPPDVQEACFELTDDTKTVEAGKVLVAKQCRSSPRKWTPQELHVVGDFVARHGATRVAWEGASKALGNRTWCACRDAYYQHLKGKM